MSWLESRLPESWDIDKVFAYDSVKLVRVLDARLGMVHCTMQFVILCYIVLYVFIIERQYLEMEKTSGWILMKALNQQRSAIGVTWDIYDRITNPGEMGAIFIPTRIFVTKNQTEGVCKSLTEQCKTHEDCLKNHELEAIPDSCDNGYCKITQWCPPENPASPATDIHYLQISDVELWFKAYVHFHKFGLDVATTDETKEVMYPMKAANTYPLHDLLRMANLEFTELIDNGAVIMSTVLLKCDFGSGQAGADCRSKVEVVNVDTKSGYNYVHTHHWFEGETRYQTQVRMYGIRLVAFATGMGAKAAFSQIILQVSSGIALLMVAQTAADFVLMFIVPERKHYTDQKVIQTEDFNEES